MLKFAIGLERGGQMNLYIITKRNFKHLHILTVQLYDLILMIAHLYKSTPQLYMKTLSM